MKRSLIIIAIFAVFGLVINLIRFWPDGKLHITFCDVGQGDSAYIRFPNQMDMLIDGGPDRKVLACLSKAMPFYDRSLNVVMLTHPQADHLNGLLDVFSRYDVGVFIAPSVGNATDGYRTLLETIKQKKIYVKNLYAGSNLRFGDARVAILWPDRIWVSEKIGETSCESMGTVCLAKTDGARVLGATTNVVGATTKEDLNHFSFFAQLSYGTFDALFTGDGDAKTQEAMRDYGRIVDASPADPIEVFKVPHHGSRTGIFGDFLDQLHAKIAVVSVGAKNNYGHPAKETLARLKEAGMDIFRTDQNGAVEVVSDGKTFRMSPEKPQKITK